MDTNNAIYLRSQITRYKNLHGKVKSQLTEERLKNKSEIKRIKADYKQRELALKKEISDLKTQLSELKNKVFGKSSEKNFCNDLTKKKKKNKRKRGQQKGKAGHGRTRDDQLAVDEITLSLSSDTAICSECGLPFKETSIQNQSEETDYEVIVRKKRYIQKFYKATCNCKCNPPLISAKRPRRAMNKSKYSDNFWIEVLLSKYNYQIPNQRLIEMFKSYNLNLAPGTLCGGITKLSDLLNPLYKAIESYNKAQKYRHFDETTLKVFVDEPEKKTKNWWLWQSSTKHSVVFILDRSRSADVVERFLEGSNKNTILVTDRYSAYKKARKKALAFCWAHVRRDFIRVGRGTGNHLNWALKWLRKIGKLFRYNRDRLLNKDDPVKYNIAHEKVIKQLAEIRNAAEHEQNTYQCHSGKRIKVIKSLLRHWEGLTLFVNDDNISMDNNFAEQLFRPVANFRKSSYGVHSEEYGNVTAMLLSIFGTFKLNNIRARAYLQEYLAAVATVSIDQADSIVNKFLPWDLPEEKKKRLTYC